MNDRPAHTRVARRPTKLSRSPTSSHYDEPTRVALLTDVHGNLPAFEAVLADVDTQNVDAIWFLGDLVGYGAQPDECVELASERCDLCLAGNHDLGVLDKIDIGDFSPTAAEAALWTRGARRAQETLDFLGSLAPSQIGGQAIGLYHASPRDPVWEYVLSAMQAEACMDVMPERVGAIGHSHVALRFTRDGRRTSTASRCRGGSELDLSDGRLAGEPRQRGPAARRRPARGLDAAGPRQLDREWRRVEYPIDDAAQAIVEAGPPAQPGRAALSRAVTIGAAIPRRAPGGRGPGCRRGCGSDDEQRASRCPPTRWPRIQPRSTRSSAATRTGPRTPTPGACDDIENDSSAGDRRAVEGLPDDVDAGRAPGARGEPSTA